MSSYEKPFVGNPQFPDLLKVEFGNEEFSSKLTVLKPFKRGESICRATQATFHAQKRWTSVQVDVDSHIELNSELVYMNHSCDPSVRIDCSTITIVALKDLQAGDEVTFFYPSTEWEMAQPFECWCKSPFCLGLVRGAKFIPKDQLQHYPIEKHIMKLFEE